MTPRTNSHSLSVIGMMRTAEAWNPDRYRAMTPREAREFARERNAESARKRNGGSGTPAPATPPPAARRPATTASSVRPATPKAAAPRSRSQVSAVDTLAASVYAERNGHEPMRLDASQATAPQVYRNRATADHQFRLYRGRA